jgi:hypothetical protein
MIERRDSNRLVWGIVLLALGLMLLLSNFGYGWWFGWGRWWPLVLIGLGVWMLYRRERPAQPVPEIPPGGEPVPARRYPTGAIILIGIGAAFLLEDVVGGNAFPAVVLIAIGVAVLLRDRSRS